MAAQGWTASARALYAWPHPNCSPHKQIVTSGQAGYAGPLPMARQYVRSPSEAGVTRSSLPMNTGRSRTFRRRLFRRLEPSHRTLRIRSWRGNRERAARLGKQNIDAPLGNASGRPCCRLPASCLRVAALTRMSPHARPVRTRGPRQARLHLNPERACGARTALGTVGHSRAGRGRLTPAVVTSWRRMWTSALKAITGRGLSTKSTTVWTPSSSSHRRTSPAKDRRAPCVERLLSLAARQELEVHVLAYLRPQWQRIESLYGESVKLGTTEALERFAARKLAAPADTGLDYNVILAPFCEVFGDRVKVFPLEPSRLVDGLTTHFQRILGVDRPRHPAGTLARANARRGAKELEVRRLVNAPEPDWAKGSQAYRKTRNLAVRARAGYPCH